MALHQPTAAPARRRPKDRKKQILGQARDLFVELGYHNVSMAMIAERVGITAGALYRHFATKQVLLEDVIRDSFSDLVPDSAATLTWTELLDVASAGAVERPYLGPLWSRESRYLPAEATDEVRGILRASSRMYARALLAERPELSAGQAELLAWAVQSLMVSPGDPAVRAVGTRLPGILRSAADAVGRVRLAEHLSSTGRDPVVVSPGPRLQPASTRERLLVAAMRLFAERGYQEASLADIGAQAGVSGPNLYGYFASKSDLLRAVVERATHALWIDLDAALAAHVRPPDALRAVVEGYIRIAGGWSANSTDVGSESEVAEVSRSYRREYVAEWVELTDASRSEPDHTVARVLVHISLGLIEVLTRTPHLTAAPSFRADLAVITQAVLLAPVLRPAAL